MRVRQDVLPFSFARELVEPRNCETFFCRQDKNQNGRNVEEHTQWSSAASPRTAQALYTTYRCPGAGL